jgi:hypothetical protein
MTEIRGRALPSEARPGLVRIACIVGLILALTGCRSMGPGTIGRDRLDYDRSVAESWQQQLLLNVVKLRYGDTPLFLDIASITNSYGLETQVGATVGWADLVGSGAKDLQTLSGGARYTDKPTITYSPMTGSRFTRSLMTPPSPAIVVSLIQAGWPADAVMRLLVTSANGVQNRFSAGGRARGADPEFYRLIAAMRRIQSSGSIGMRLDRKEDVETGVAVLELSKRQNLAEATEPDRREVREILGLRDGLDEVKVVFGSTRRTDDEIAMVTRSMLEVLLDLAGSAIEVPTQHVQQGRVMQTLSFDTDSDGGFSPLLTVRSGPQRPRDPFVAVCYRNHWFWIDDCDPRSKGIFSFLLILSSLTESDSPKSTPLITIPAG